MRLFRRLLVLVLIVGVFVAVVQFRDRNQEQVVIDLLAMQTPPVAVWLALVASFALGAVGASASLLYQVARKSLVARRYRKTVAGLESEIHQLRNLPLAGDEEPAAGSGERAPEAGGLANRGA